MASVRHILEALETIAPPDYALPGDKIGLQIGEPGAEVRRAMVSLDRSAVAIGACVDSKCELLLAHHPIIWQPLASLTDGSDAEVCIRQLVRAGVNVIAAHTNWDCARGGVNDALAGRLKLADVSPFGPAAASEGMKLVTFCPEAVAEAIIDAVSAAGAGAVGDYRRCAFVASGEGTFDAPQGSSPAVGATGSRNQVPEVRLEMDVPPPLRLAVERALRAAHPYEEPAIDFLVTKREGMPIGRKGRLPAPMSAAQLRDFLDGALGARSLAWVAKEQPIEWLGVIGGAADDMWPSAREAGCDALVTGEVKQHIAVEATASGMTIVAAGHYATEQPGAEALANAMRKAVQTVEWTVFVPPPGKGGRPLE